jgi:hypothetical protein
MPDRLDFDSARDLIAQIAPTDTWDEATERATADTLVALDTDEPTEHPPRRWRRPNPWLVAVAACVLAALVLAAVAADRQSVDTKPPLGSPTTDCPNPTYPRTITPGGQMRNRFAAPVASAATAILLLSACDDGPTTIAKGEDVELVGDSGDLGSQTLNIDVEEKDGKVTGEFRVTDNVFTVECVDTDTDGFVILGGVATSEGPDVPKGDMVAMIIREGDPDSVALQANDIGAESCTDLLDSISDDELSNEANYNDVEAGSTIETG